KIRSTAHLSCAYSLSCNSAKAVTPVANASFALGLSASLVKSSVSSGSRSLRRKFLPLLMRNGLASSLALLMISFVFISSQWLITTFQRRFMVGNRFDRLIQVFWGGKR